MILDFNTESWILLLVAGACGAFVRDSVKDNMILLPKLEGKKLYLGCIGSMIVGAMIGYFVDNSPITAFFAGFVGIEAITAIMPEKYKLTKDK
jgi:fluoride ion exporter CrcB/FEX